MKKIILLVLLTLVSSLVLSACGGGGGKGGPPVEMQKFEGSEFTVEYPKAWKESKMEVFGISMVIFGKEELSMDQIQSMDFEEMLTDPFVLIMKVPGEMSGQMGFDDIDTAIDEFQTIVPEEEGEIVKQGETTIGDAKGKYVVVKGNHPEYGEIGMHLVAAKRDDGSVVIFMGATPESDRDKNLDIFDYMHKNLKFK